MTSLTCCHSPCGVLKAAKELDPELPVIVMTAFGSIQDAVAAMREGALDFLAKPVDPDHLTLMVERALSQRRLATENLLLKEELASRRGAPQIVGEDPKLKHVTVALHRAAATDTTVLLEGESGTGKELAARAIHRASPRAERPFVAVNCATLSETLLESELFGHEKGAFTGAAARKPGKVEVADTGTLFLDEVGEIPLPLQAKLLRFLQEREFERLGSTRPIQVDVRVIAATNRNLGEAVRAGTFREDLYYRLNVITLSLPPLRERREDIPLLVHHFVRKHGRALGLPGKQVAVELMARLERYHWPGNVRELEHTVERAVLLAEGDTVRSADLSLRGGGDGAARIEQMSLEEVERLLIQKALARFDGNVSSAAKALGLSRSALYRRLERHGL